MVVFTQNNLCKIIATNIKTKNTHIKLLLDHHDINADRRTVRIKSTIAILQIRYLCKPSPGLPKMSEYLHNMIILSKNNSNLVVVVY